MPSLSDRGISMQASPIRKLVPFAEAAKKRGVTVFHLNIGQPDIETPKQALDVLKHIDETTIEYTHSAGYEFYREGLVDYYRSVGISPLTKDNIIITTGGSEAIIFAMLSCMNPGDEIIIPEPFYTNYNGFAEQAGVTIIPITSSIETGFALPPISEFEEKITSKTKAIMICNPNNPTGYLYQKEELLSLQEIVIKHDLFLFSDEVYREFCYDGYTHHSVMQLEKINDRVILLDSVSKRYSECGIRIGALVSRNMEIINTALKFAQARLCPPALGQIVANASLQTDKEYFTNVYGEYLGRRDLIIERLNKMEGVFSPNPKGAFYTLARLPIDSSEKFCEWLLNEFTFNGQTLMLAPAEGFYATPGLGKDEVRIAYVYKKDILDKAMDVLEEALRKYPGRTIL